jgi:hypothetical protein
MLHRYSNFTKGKKKGATVACNPLHTRSNQRPDNRAPEILPALQYCRNAGIFRWEHRILTPFNTIANKNQHNTGPTLGDISLSGS